MRRIDPTHLPRFLRSEDAPPKGASEQPGPWRASLELRSITPILGGGVQSFEPDTVDVVRVPAIRGHLRWWWRGLYQDWSDSAEGADADALFTREAQLWGGVGVPGQAREGAKESPGLRSRVRITVGSVDPGKVEAAGRHTWSDFGLKAVPEWDIGQNLGYALFPLQRPKPERDDHARREGGTRRELPTHSVRKELKFRLQIAITGEKPGLEPNGNDIVQVLAAVWAWIFFGGIGARTRRGFGVLELKAPPSLSEISGTDRDLWRRIFRGPDEERGLVHWLQDFERLASPRGRLWPFRILIGRSRRAAAGAHEEMVSHLRYFRQAPGFARNPGSPRPGQSRWPEPHLLRALAPPGDPFAHKPPADVIEAVAAGEVGAPRAAFGLPIQVQFKDGGDQRANASLLPIDAQRWPSPLLLRPLRRADGYYVPAAVLLPIRPPSKVSVKFVADPEDPKRCAVAKAAGSHEPITRLLKTAHGDALKAFEDWLLAEKGFQKVSPTEEGGSRA